MNYITTNLPFLILEKGNKRKINVILFDFEHYLQLKVKI